MNDDIKIMYGNNYEWENINWEEGTSIIIKYTLS